MTRVLHGCALAVLLPVGEHRLGDLDAGEFSCMGIAALIDVADRCGISGEVAGAFECLVACITSITTGVHQSVCVCTVGGATGEACVCQRAAHTWNCVGLGCCRQIVAGRWAVVQRRVVLSSAAADGHIHTVILFVLSVCIGVLQPLAVCLLRLQVCRLNAPSMRDTVSDMHTD